MSCFLICYVVTFHEASSLLNYDGILETANSHWRCYQEHEMDCNDREGGVNTVNRKHIRFQHHPPTEVQSRCVLTRARGISRTQSPGALRLTIDAGIPSCVSCCADSVMMRSERKPWSAQETIAPNILRQAAKWLLLREDQRVQCWNQTSLTAGFDVSIL